MPGRQVSNTAYRYGFNGQEQDAEWRGGQAVSFRFRIHDVRLGRFLSVDPLAPEYPWNSSYAFAENMVIYGSDLEGAEIDSKIEANEYAQEKSKTRKHSTTAADPCISCFFVNMSVGIGDYLHNLAKSMPTTPSHNAYGYQPITQYDLDNRVTASDFAPINIVKTGANIAVGTGESLYNFVEGVATGNGHKVGYNLIPTIGTISTAAKALKRPVANTMDGIEINASLINKRKKLANDFYFKSGITDDAALGHMDGINFDRAVYTQILSKGTKLYRYTRSGKTGSYYTTSKTATQKDVGLLMIEKETHLKQTIILTNEVKVLRSTVNLQNGKVVPQVFSTEITKNSIIRVVKS